MLPCRPLQSKLWAVDNLVHPGATLLPLLYYTPTIQQRSYTRVSRGVRSKPRLDIRPKDFRPVLESKDRVSETSDRLARSDRTPRDALSGIYDEERGVPRRDHRRTDHVPFEKLKQEEAAGADSNMENSTITPSEKKAFEKLFSMRKSPATLEEGKLENLVGRPTLEIGSGSRTTSNAKRSFDSASTAAKRPAPEFPLALRSMAEQALARDNTASATSLSTTTSNTTPRPGDVAQKQRDEAKALAIQRHLTEVTTLLNQARTDIELWQVLRTHVMDRVAALELDGPHAPAPKASHRVVQSELTREKKAAKASKKENPTKGDGILDKNPTPDLQTLTTTFPAHLLTFMTLIRTSFPASAHLGLAVLPALKKLGPSAFALGATTELYDAHMNLLYTKFTDVPAIVDVLAEMDKEVYEFGSGTLGLLDRILNDARRAARGAEGEGVKMLWSTERMRRAIKALAGWREVVEERRQEGALRRAREKEAVWSVEVMRLGDRGRVDVAVNA